VAKTEKDGGDDIIKQIQTMKSVIEDFKVREKDQKSALEKLKEKDKRIRELTKEVANLRVKEENSSEIEKLKKENEYVKEQQAKVIFSKH